jgi:hypothetical protein
MPAHRPVVPHQRRRTPPGCRGVRMRRDLAKETACHRVRADPGGRRPFRAGSGRLSTACAPCPGPRGVASSPTTGTGRGGADAGTVTRARRGVRTHENPFRWSRGGADQHLECTGAAAAGKTFVRSLIGLAERCCIARPRRCARTRRRPVPEGASGVRTIARKSHCSRLNSSPTPGREGVRIRAVSARFEPFRAVLDRFGPESHGRNDRFGSEATPCDLDCHLRAHQGLLGEASMFSHRVPPALRGVWKSVVAWTRGRALSVGIRANTPVPGRWCRRHAHGAAGSIHDGRCTRRAIRRQPRRLRAVGVTSGAGCASRRVQWVVLPRG